MKNEYFGEKLNGMCVSKNGGINNICIKGVCKTQGLAIGLRSPWVIDLNSDPLIEFHKSDWNERDAYDAN